MSTVTIKVKSKKLKKGDSIPELDSKSQKVVIVNNGDTIKWKYDDSATITVNADTAFNSNSSSTTSSGKGETQVTVNGAVGLQDKIISYNISTSDTDAVLDPVIVVKDPEFKPSVLKNPIFWLTVGFISGFIIGLLL
ncbi:MAG: hypothetical protein HWD86_05575 [Kangiellaceae bacterium]|nr:hypothetical protein [Kangiellaceae bacterium]